MSLFITGTGTHVGKTVVTAGLASALLQQGLRVCVYKPIQTGSPVGQMPEDLLTIQSWCHPINSTSSSALAVQNNDSTTSLGVFCSYCFPEPVAPYVADPGRQIDPEKLLQDFQALKASYDVVLVEGAGGVLVPIAPDFLMVDLMRLFNCPVLVVSTPWLGSINHTLLTVEALQTRGCEVKGVLVSGMPIDHHADHADSKNTIDGPEFMTADRDPSVETFLPTLEAFLPVPLLGSIPKLVLEPGCFTLPENRAHFEGFTTQF